MGEIIHAYKMLVEHSEGMRPLEKPRCRWKDTIKMDLKKIGCGVDSSGSG
jgi:hypothetical protein